MKHKNLLRVLAIVLVLAMSVSILAACGDKGGSSTPSGKSGGDEKVQYLLDSTSSEGFITTMFNSANQIGKGVSVDTSTGKDIALNLGVTLSIIKDDVELPIAVSIKGFVDRTNVTYDKTTKYYYLNANNSTEIEVAIKENDVDFLKLTLKLNANENDVAEDLNDNVYGIVYGVVAGHKVKVSLETLCDVSDDISAENYLFNLFEGFITDDDGIVKTILNAFNGNNFDLNSLISGLINSSKTYVTQITVDGAKTWSFASSNDDGEYVEAEEGVYRKYNKNTDGEEVARYDIIELKYVSTRKHYKYDEDNGYVEDANGEYVVKTLADTLFGVGFEIEISGMSLSLSDTIKGMIFDSTSTLSADEQEKALYNMFGEVLDIGSLLKSLSPTLFPEPVWNVCTDVEKHTFTEYSGEKKFSAVKEFANRELSAHATLSLLGLDGLVAASPLVNAIEIGFTKTAGDELEKTPESTDSVNLGKMDEFYLSVILQGLSGSGTLGVKLAVTDLKVGNTKEAAGLVSETIVDSEYSDTVAFDMGVDITSDADFMEILVKEIKSGTGLDVVVGGDTLDFDLTTGKISFPESIKLNIAANIHLFDNTKTAIILSLVAGDKGEEEDVINAQIYGTEDGEDLVADIQVAEDYVPLIEEILNAICVFTNDATIGEYNFTKDTITGDWYFNYADNATDGVYYSKLSKIFNNFVKTGAMRVEGLDLNRLITFALNSHDFSAFMKDDSQAEAAAYTFGDLTMDFVLTAIMGTNKKGAIEALYKIINIDETSINIGGTDLLSKVATVLFDTEGSVDTYAKNNGTITPFVAIGALMEIFGDIDNIDVMSLIMGSEINAIDAYLDIEDTLVDGLCRGIATKKGLMVLLQRASDDNNNVEKALVTYNEKVGSTVSADKTACATALNTINKAGYAIVKDTTGKYVTYPKVLYSYLKYNKDKASVLSAMGASYDSTKGEFIVTSVDTLKADLVTALNSFNATSTDRSASTYYLKSASVVSILKQLYRQGISAVPYRATAGTWTASDITYNKNFVDDGIISTADVTVSLYMEEESETVLSRGGVKVNVVYNDKKFSVDVYGNIFSEAGKNAKASVKSAADFYTSGSAPTNYLYLDIVEVEDED